MTDYETNLLDRISELEQQLAVLRAEVEKEEKENKSTNKRWRAEKGENYWTVSDYRRVKVEDWSFTDEQREEISQIVAKAVIDYINENDLQPKGYKVIDIEFIEVGE